MSTSGHSSETSDRSSQAYEYWNNRWKTGDVKWDLGEPAPSLGYLLDSWAIQKHLNLCPKKEILTKGPTADDPKESVSSHPPIRTLDQEASAATDQHNVNLGNRLKPHSTENESGEKAEGEVKEGAEKEASGTRTPISGAIIDTMPLAEAMDLQKLACEPSPAAYNEYRHALVPGCGSGYDVVLLAQYGWRAKGIDLSPIAIDRARRIASDSPDSDGATFAVENFFDTQAPTGGYQLIFDYTFFCALDPKLREAWARKMSQLLAKHGILVTLMFPTKQLTDNPPPHTSAPEDYTRVLSPYFDLVGETIAGKGPASRREIEMIALWRLKEAEQQPKH